MVYLYKWQPCFFHSCSTISLFAALKCKKMKRERLEHEKDLKSKHRKMMDVEKKDRQRVFELSTDGMESEFINRIRISEENTLPKSFRYTKLYFRYDQNFIHFRVTSRFKPPISGFGRTRRDFTVFFVLRIYSAISLSILF